MTESTPSTLFYSLTKGVHKSFLALALSSVLLSILLITGRSYDVELLQSSSVYSLSSVYYVITFIVCVSIVAREHKGLFVRGMTFKNLLCLVLASPIPLLLVLTLPYAYHQFKRDTFVLRPITDFQLNETCIQENERVRVVYASKAPEQGTKAVFYYHALVVSDVSGDTLNILSTWPVSFTSHDAKRYYSRTMLKVLANSSTLDSSSHIDRLTAPLRGLVLTDYQEVKREQYARYKTAIGELVLMKEPD